MSEARIWKGDFLPSKSLFEVTFDGKYNVSFHCKTNSIKLEFISCETNYFLTEVL